ncbi:sensory transduction histidine kinase [Methanosarcina sp. Kolksee]|uniref:PAS domain S-box protein n=1 Tax=Methanosarcina sp. Kolksee TaxID=1434099 RepID=UPI0006154B6F|nr:PAS domain S-box protein [Methanosarcina sp. Kolksee]AKB47299.1 sensory transduction histidine kinase [Methanosarcina sp. Kolksee]
MEKSLRKSGIEIIGEVPWGTHFCQFYQTKQDLIDILVPYFKAGLENNEFCMWVTSEPLDVEEAKGALRKSIPEIDVYLEKGQIEIIPYTYWYVKEGIFDSQKVLNGWIEKLNRALANGYDGLRLSGNTFWLEKKDWNNFVDYEEEIDSIIGNYSMIALCTYCLERCSATEIIDVVINHQFALVKKEDKWTQIESSRRKEAEKTAIQATKNWEHTFDSVPDLIAIIDEEYRVVRANKAIAERLGVTPEECVGLKCYRAIHGTNKPPSFCPHRQLLADGLEHITEVHEDSLGGDFIVSVSPIHDYEGKIAGSIHVARNITERKRAELEREIIVEFLRLVNESRSTSELVHSSVKFFKGRSGFEAVGIRLREGEDYPYFETSGFPEEFVRFENSLCTRDPIGQPIRDSNGYPIHECMCGNIIHGRFDPSKLFFTKKGSFCTNSTTELLATTTDADRQANTRNRCNGEGYESVALIALRVGGECLGLLQLNDRRKGQFSPETISLWERLAEYLAIAIAKTRAEDALREAYENIQVQAEELEAQTDDLQESYEALSESKKRFELLSEANALLLSSKEPETTIQTIAEKVMRHLNCDVFFNYVFDEVQSRLHLKAYGGTSAESAKEIEWLDEGIAICGCVASNGCLIVSEDVQHNGDKRADLVRSMGIQAYACQPLHVGEKTIGTLSFGTKSRKSFTRDELALMSTVADQVSVAIERKRAVEALQRERSLLESVMRTTDFMLAFFDPQFNFLWANAAYAESCHMKLEDIIGKNHFALYPHEENEAIFRKVRDTGEGVFYRDKPFFYPDQPELGVTYWDWSLVPVKNPNGNVTGLVLSLRETTKYKQAEDDLREAYDNLQVQSEELQAQAEELQEAYEALSESEKQYRMLFTSMTDGFFLGEPIYDKDGTPRDYRFLEINPAFECQTGLKRKEISDKTIQEVLHNPSHLLIEKYGEVALSGKSTHVEIFSQGLDRYLDSYVFSPEKGKFAVILRDITERKQAEEALRESEARRKVTEAVQAERERLNSVLDMLPAYVILLSADHSVPFANRFFEERFGKSEGRRCYEYLFQRTEPCENCETYKVLKTGAPHRWEWLGPDGRNYDVYDYPFKDSDGSTLILEVGIDITEIKQAQAAVQAERQRLFDVLETLPAMISLLTPDYHIAFANRGFREKFGESGGRHCYEYCYECTRPCEFYETYKVLETGQPHHWEGTTPDGSIIDSYDFPFTDIDGSPMILKMDIDVTEQKRAETELKKHREQLENAYNSLKESERSLYEAQRMAHLGNWDWNIVTNELYWSDEIYRIFGRSPQEFGATFDAFLSYVHPDDRDYVNNAVKEALNGKKYNINHRITLASGEERIVHEQAEVIFNEENIPVHMRGTVQDITEQKKAEKALELANTYNRSLIEASIDPFVAIGPDGKITDVNNSTEFVTGYSRKELIGTDFSDYFTEPEKAREGYQNAFQKGLVRNYSLKIQHKNGQITPVLYNSSVYRDETGEVIGVFAAARDICEQKKAEEKIQVLASAVESSDDAIMTKSIDGIITSWNKGAEQIYGYLAEEIIGQNISILEPDNRKGEIKQLAKKIQEEERIQHYETVRLRKDRTLIDISVTLSPVLDVSDQLIAFSVIARDITERKKAEETLRLSSIYNRSLIEVSLDPMVTIGPDGRITDVNKATELATGYSRNELIGTDFSDYFTDPEKAREGYQHFFREGLVLDYELEIQHKNGRVTPVLYNASIYKDENGAVIGAFAAARDITERKKAEELLKLKLEELARSNAELEQFAYVSSHDLQEPLRMIASYLQLLQRKYQGKLDEKADKYIYFAVDGASRMQNLINDLLEFSRVTTKTREFEPTDCKSVLDKVLFNLEVSIKENEASISSGSLPVVMADPVQFIQLFQNLISNAIKFRSENAPKIEISAEKKAGQWLFLVKDNGIGINPKYSERIFEVFKRLNKREEYPGTGIGLSICKKIIERHGGQIWVESEPGKGSTFYFTLPVIPIKVCDKDYTVNS